MNTASSRISELRYLDPSGNEIAGPREWTPSLIEVPASPEHLGDIHLFRNGEPLRLFAQSLRGCVRLLAEWPRSGTGAYRLTLEHGDVRDDREVLIIPEKI